MAARLSGARAGRWAGPLWWPTIKEAEGAYEQERFPRPLAKQPPSAAARAAVLPQRWAPFTIGAPPVGGMATAVGGCVRQPLAAEKGGGASVACAA